MITDPSYAGQLVTFTYPELGNTGVNPEDQEAERPMLAERLPVSWLQGRATGAATASRHMDG